MKKISKFLAIIFIPLLILSCKKDNPGGVITTPLTPFHFLEKITIIEVDENVKSFELVGAFSKEPKPSYNKYFPANLDAIRSTAKHKTHFINNINDKYDRRDGLKIYKKFKIIPENIKEEVQLVFYVSYAEVDIVDSTIIRLVPKVIKQ